MFYDVLIYYYGLDSNKPVWSKLPGVRNFQRVLFLYKKEIQSSEYLIYVRKILDNKQPKKLVTNFKLISNVSYTFAHYPKIDEYRNKYLCDKFDKVGLFTDRSLLK